MFTVAVKKQRTPGSVLLSAACHAAILLAIWTAMRSGRTRPVYVESRCCSTALYWSPAAADSGTPRPKHKTVEPRRTPAPRTVELPVVAPAPVVAEQPSPTQSGMTSPQQLASLGIGSGSDDAEPALPIFHPKPPVADRSLLPAKEQDVIVNVDISSVGEVIDETLVQGLGNPADQIVLETIRGWHFQPATLNGTAVASAQKIVIPMSRDLTPDAS